MHELKHRCCICEHSGKELSPVNTKEGSVQLECWEGCREYIFSPDVLPDSDLNLVPVRINYYWFCNIKISAFCSISAVKKLNPSPNKWEQGLPSTSTCWSVCPARRAKCDAVDGGAADSFLTLNRGNNCHHHQTSHTLGGF